MPIVVQHREAATSFEPGRGARTHDKTPFARDLEVARALRPPVRKLGYPHWWSARTGYDVVHATTVCGCLSCSADDRSSLHIGLGRRRHLLTNRIDVHDNPLDIGVHNHIVHRSLELHDGNTDHGGADLNRRLDRDHGR